MIKSDSLRGVALLVLAGVATFGLPVVLGLSWVPSPNLPFNPSTERTPAFMVAYDTFSFAHAEWPWREVIARQVRERSLPVWNPFSSMGIPLAGIYQPQVFLPVEWLEIAFGERYFGVFVVIKVWLAAWGAWSLSRLVVRSTAAAVAAAVLYMFSAYPLWFYSVPEFINASVIVPWLFWAILRIGEPSTAWMRRTAVASVFVGLLLVGGQPQLALLSLSSAALFIFCRLLQPRCRRRAWREACGFAVGLALGFGLALPQLSLFAEALQHGYTLHSPGAYAAGGTATLNFINVLSPFLLGQLMWPWGHAIQQLNWEAFPFVLGGVGLFGVIVGIIALNQPRHDSGISDEVHAKCTTVAFLGVLVVPLTIIVAASLGVPGLWSTPILNRVNLPRYITPVLSICSAVIVAYGIATAAHMSNRRRLIVGLLYIGCSAVISWQVVPILISPPSAANPSYYSASLWLGIVPYVVTSLCLLVTFRLAFTLTSPSNHWGWTFAVLAFAQGAFWVRYGLPLQYEQARLIVLVLGCAAAFLVLYGRTRSAFILLVALTLATGILISYSPKRLSAYWDPYEHPPPYVTYLQQRLGPWSQYGRVATTWGALIPNVAAGFGIAQLETLAPVQIKTTADFIFHGLATHDIHYTVPNAWPGVGRDATYPNWDDYVNRRQYYNFLGVRFLIDTANGSLTERPLDGVDAVLSDGQIRIFEDSRAWPRALMFHGTVRNADSLLEAQASVFSEHFDFGRELVIEHFDRASPQPLNRSIEGVRIEHYTANKIELGVNAVADGVLILTDAFYPGWKVYVDAREEKIYRVNASARGVYVSAGGHRVVFQYQPTHIAGIGALSAASLVGIVVMLRTRRPR